MTVYLSAPGLVAPHEHGGRQPALLAAPGTPGGERWFDPAVHLAGRKTRYLSRATRYLLAAAQQSLDAAGELFAALPQDRRGIVVGTNFADYAVRHESDRVMLAQGSGALNSIQAPNVSINIPATQLAIAHRHGGVCATLTTSGIAGIEAIVYAMIAIERERVDAALVGSTEDNGSDASDGILLPAVMPGSCTLAAFSDRAAAPAPAQAHEIVGWHWRRYAPDALADAAGAMALRRAFAEAMVALLATAPRTVALCWPQRAAASPILQGWLYAALDKARIDVHLIDPPVLPAHADAGCNTSLMSLQFALQTAGKPLLFVATHPSGNLVALYFQPRFCH